MLIRLSKASSESGGGTGKALGGDSVTVACPDHLVLADLPVAKGIGAATAATVVKTVGRRSRRQLGERVHFCVRCDFPIAIYGRLSPCEHAFCLDCARSDSICYLCDDRIQKIQTIKIMEGIFICAAPHCLKSFLKRTEFESHIQESHADLVNPNTEKENGEDSEVQSAKQLSASGASTSRPSEQSFPRSRPLFAQPEPIPRPPGFDFQDKQHHPDSHPPTPQYGQPPSYYTETGGGGDQASFMGYMGNYPHQWNSGGPDGFPYPGMMPPPPPPNKGVEGPLSHPNRPANFYSGDMGHDGPGFAWKHDANANPQD